MFIKRRYFVKNLTYYCCKQCCVFISFSRVYYDKEINGVYHQNLSSFTFL